MKLLRSGYIRHIIVRIGFKTKEVMCIIVNNGENLPKEKELVEEIKKEFKTNQKLEQYELKTIVKNINSKDTNVILGNKNITLYGDGYIYDKLGDYTFKISPMSFYQTNPVQTEVLYNKAIEFANLQGNETVLDLYCGIGTIGIFASSKAKKVYGIEIVEDAIKDAKENARLNNIENIEFLCGDVENVLGTVLEKSLTSKGFNVIHDMNYHDYPAYNGSYNRSFNTVKNLLVKNPTTQLVIDLHRDAIGSMNNYAPCVKIGDEIVSQLMFVIGTNGGGMEHPNWQTNFKLAIKIQEKANELYPGLFRPIILRNSRYNQNLADGACIIEVGATGNTLEQTTGAMKYLAEVIYQVMNKK